MSWGQSHSLLVTKPAPRSSIPYHMEIWTRLIEGQNLKLRCRCFATFFCGDAVFIFFRGVAVWTVPQCPPHYYTLNPYGTVIQFLHVIYKSKEKTNLLCILNNVSQYSKIRTRKRNAKKSIKTEKKIGIQPFLESGIHWAGIRNPQGGIQNPRLSWIPLHGANSD